MKRFVLFFLFVISSTICAAEGIYEYAGLPRIFINTQNSKPVMDRETEIPGTMTLQKKPSGIQKKIEGINIRCRGNSSFKDMPKHSYRIHGEKRFSPFGMPHHKDWALITNYADPSMIRNKVTYVLAKELGASFSPRTVDVELFINGNYEGVYLLVETPKVAESRINIGSNEFLVEIDYKYHPEDHVFFNEEKRPFNIKHPKNPSRKQIANFSKFIEDFEKYLTDVFENSKELGELSKWIDQEDYLRFYWIQEVAKNPDLFLSSTYFTAGIEGPIHMGPVWDFDAAYGIYPKKTNPMEWKARKRGWNKQLFKNPAFRKTAKDYWSNHRKTFESMLDSIDVFSSQLTNAAVNNYERWATMQDTTSRFFVKKYNNYGEAVLSFRRWYKQRLDWIDRELEKE